jgi:hypothetical protein
VVTAPVTVLGCVSSDRPGLPSRARAPLKFLRAIFRVRRSVPWPGRDTTRTPPRRHEGHENCFAIAISHCCSVRLQADRGQVRLKAGHSVLRHCEKTLQNTSCSSSLRGSGMLAKADHEGEHEGDEDGGIRCAWSERLLPADPGFLDLIEQGLIAHTELLGGAAAIPVNLPQRVLDDRPLGLHRGGLGDIGEA